MDLWPSGVLRLGSKGPEFDSPAMKPSVVKIANHC